MRSFRNRLGFRIAPASPLERWLLALTRIAIIGLATSILARIRLPLIDDWLPMKDIVVAVVGIILAGKCLFDTLFYDHFQP